MTGKFSIISIAVIIAGALSVQVSSEDGAKQQQIDTIISMLKPKFISLKSDNSQCPEDVQKHTDKLLPFAEDPFQCDKKKAGEKSCICYTMQHGDNKYFAFGKTCAICKMAAMSTTGEMEKLKFKSFIIGNQIARFLGGSEGGNNRLVDPQVGLEKSFSIMVKLGTQLLDYMDRSFKMKFASSFLEAASMLMPESYMQLKKEFGTNDDDNGNEMNCGTILHYWDHLVQANIDINSCLTTGKFKDIEGKGDTKIKCKNEHGMTNEDICNDIYSIVNMLDLHKDISPKAVPAYCTALNLAMQNATYMY